jgi:hypothetical protein
MSSAPADLLQFRTDTRAVTGLGAVDVGIVGDGAHQRTGGYHEARDVLTMIGRYHGPASANVGSSGEDYSARQARDRNGLTANASATDVGSQWPHGGRAAWLRWNNLLYQEMRDRPGNLPALRAVNICLDGRTKQRYDQLHRGDGLIPSTDTVDTHTHLELWRDTEGNRVATLNRLVQLMHAAINGTTPQPAVQEVDMQLGDTFTIPNWDNDPRLKANEPTSVQTALAVAQQRSYQAKANTDLILAQLKANAAADEIRDKALQAAVDGITSNGGPDSAPIVAAVKKVGDDAQMQFTALHARIAELEAELEQTRHAQHNAAQAEADATADHA